MRRSNWTPSIVPNDHDQTIYLVMDSYKSGPSGSKLVSSGRLEAVIMSILEGQYSGLLASTRQRNGRRMSRPK